MTAAQVITAYITFFKNKGHVQIPNAPLVPENDPTTLFTSSGMQPLVPYLLGEIHPAGKRLVNVQNAFRAVDIEEVGNNRHTTFFRMLGNWSLGDYFKTEQLPWIFEFLTKDLEIDPKRLYVTVFEGTKDVSKDTESVALWKEIFANVGLDAEKRIFYYGTEKNWWSRSGIPEKMPVGEPGGPDSEVFYDFGPELQLHRNSQWKNEECHVNCDCGRYVEICNNVFMQYKKASDGSLQLLRNPNVDFGGGLERLLLAVDNQPDVFKTNLFAPIIKTLEQQTGKKYHENEKSMRLTADHFTASCFIILAKISPSNTEQGYILRRLIRRGFDNFSRLTEADISPVLEAIVDQYKETDPQIVEGFELIKNTILAEIQTYKDTLSRAKKYIEKKYDLKQKEQISDELIGQKVISSEDAFILYATHGLSPTQIENLGYSFDKKAFAQKMEQHQNLSRKGAEKKFAGGLADHQERTVMGHTATHLLHQALRDVLGNQVHQTGSNITTERLRFDFNYDQKLTDEQIQKIEAIVKEKIKQGLPVHFDMLPLKEAKDLQAIGLFEEKYQEKVKVYFIGGSDHQHDQAYSKEFCGGPHVENTKMIQSFKITKQENIGNKQRRIYATVG